MLIYREELITWSMFVMKNSVVNPIGRNMKFKNLLLLTAAAISLSSFSAQAMFKDTFSTTAGKVRKAFAGGNLLINDSIESPKHYKITELEDSLATVDDSMPIYFASPYYSQTPGAPLYAMIDCPPTFIYDEHDPEKIIGCVGGAPGIFKARIELTVNSDSPSNRGVFQSIINQEDLSKKNEPLQSASLTSVEVLPISMNYEVSASALNLEHKNLYADYYEDKKLWVGIEYVDQNVKDWWKKRLNLEPAGYMLKESSSNQGASKNSNYLSAWAGFDHNLNYPEGVTWVAYASTQPIEQPLYENQAGYENPHIKMAMTVQIGDVFYSPLGIYKSPIGERYDEEHGLDHKNLALFFHSAVANLVDKTNPGKVKYMVVRPLPHMGKILNESSIPFSVSSGQKINTTLPHIRTDAFCEQAEPIILIDPETNNSYTIGKDHWFEKSLFLGAPDARYNGEIMSKFPFMTTKLEDLASYLKPKLNEEKLKEEALIWR